MQITASIDACIIQYWDLHTVQIHLNLYLWYAIASPDTDTMQLTTM